MTTVSEILGINYIVIAPTLVLLITVIVLLFCTITISTPIYVKKYVSFLGVLPVSVLFAMGFDWGRWVNIFYVILALIYFQLLIKEHLTLNLETLRQNFLYKIKGKVFVILFILFCFGWNPKTVITGDVASFPGYRIPYKVFKTLSN